MIQAERAEEIPVIYELSYKHSHPREETVTI